MSETATISGTITQTVSPSGPSVAFILGAPVITSSSTTGATLSYDEGGPFTMKVAQGDGVVSVPFGTVADSDMFYIGTDQAVDVKLNGSSDAISLVAGGFILINAGSITVATVEATTSNDATLSVVILGA